MRAATHRAFEIHSTAKVRARRFYSDVFGWRLLATPRRAVFVVCAGVGPRSSTRIADVADLEACLERALNRGGRVVIPAMKIGSLGWVAYLTDPDGNVLCLRQLS